MAAAALEVAGLRKRFGAVEALRGVTFSVAAGEVFGYLGPNGAGKTTTQRILLGLVRARSRSHGRCTRTWSRATSSWAGSRHVVPDRAGDHCGRRDRGAFVQFAKHDLP